MLHYLNALTYLIQAHWTNTNTESTFCNTKFPWNWKEQNPFKNLGQIYQVIPVQQD